MPRMLPNGSITDAVTKPSPRSVGASCSVAPNDSSRCRAAVTSSTCQYTTAPAGPVAGPVAAVDHPEFVLVVAEPKLHIPRAFEVGIDAQQFGVPAFRGGQIGGPETDRGESSQHRVSLTVAARCARLTDNNEPSPHSAHQLSTVSATLTVVRAHRLVATRLLMQARGRVTAPEVAEEHGEDPVAATRSCVRHVPGRFGRRPAPRVRQET